MAELLIELFSEEIPARMQARAAEEFRTLLQTELAAAGLTEATLRAHVTPRRLTLVADGLPVTRPDVREERRGPKIGAPDQAVQGFLKASGLSSLDQCVQRDGYWYAELVKIGGATADVLPDAIERAIRALVWPKSMRWSETVTRWVRPLHTIIALFDGKVLPGQINLGGGLVIAFGNKTEGHRFMARGPFEVSSFAQYEATLRAHKVILDREERKTRILEGATALAKSHGLVLKDDPGLLEEVAGLVEWPVTLCGAFDPEFLDVPQEVLIATMRGNQKYFALVDAAGKLSNRFVITSNMETADSGAAIIDGNQRVLRARLSDARFFWDQDRKERLEDRLPRLQDITFHDKLGTLSQKVERMTHLAVHLAVPVGASPEHAKRAAELCKADLVSGMVGEFPEVQGRMGYYYARQQNEAAEVAQAIAEHYSPVGPQDSCPQAPTSVALALADKIDTLVGFFAIGQKPTGSKDPYALRRAALGVIRMVLENGLRLEMDEIFAYAMRQYLDQDCAAVEERLKISAKAMRPYHDVSAIYREHMRADLVEFFDDRLKVMLRERGFRHDLIEAVFAVTGADDLLLKVRRLEALDAFLSSEHGASLMTAYRRAVNIVRAEEKKDGTTYSADAINPALVKQAEEGELLAALNQAGDRIAPALAQQDYQQAMSLMATLRGPVDAFFDKVTVNDADVGVRLNRLSILARIRGTMDQVADFTRIEG